MNQSQKQSASKFLSLILRHKPEEIGIVLDENGWVSVDELLSKLQKTKYKLRFEQLKDIVDTDEKGRYSFGDDFTRIRANQGHSIQIDLQLKEVEPLEVLYHGTANSSVPNIKKQGLKKMNRQHVHLSKDEQTAFKVGARHGFPVVLKIKAKQMHEDGYKFYLSDNGVWLTEQVPVKYIIFS